VSLREPARAKAIDERLGEIVPTGVEPRASAVMLRALSATPEARKRASAIGCDVLKRPAGPSSDEPGSEELVEAALLAIANDSPLACADAVQAALVDMCIPQLRCSGGAPMTGREADSHWDEPTCTKPELATAVTKELERPASEILDLAAGTRRELFALAALAAADKVPPAFVAAQERRRYAVVQPKDPACENGLAPNTPCHCDENTVRAYGCRAGSPHKPAGESTGVHVGVCKFEIDDKNKKLTNVVATPPP
jgi:hypothetical protein